MTLNLSIDTVLKEKIDNVHNKPFPSSLGLCFKTSVGAQPFDTEIIFHSHANKTNFHKKGCEPSLILKVRVFGTRKWPIRTNRVKGVVLFYFFLLVKQTTCSVT